ncbi:peptidoglycan-binding domain-containing protein [Enterovibrio sp. ZSDZ42]|uniref:Peptidoglycan-binding domain-containing protein n=1 Tax=Enterovibrio gelatinilyticus TaxID=2899819 RepID=A0ABT5R468_9GAMM|nr:peptidoglycan-binding domain-containing protein [Enterovibrio sp. ZSDZ42]MDD1795064.1 peptidoglycan-binding domain-containing protein [Enterovibrio sp. ZSDZ42]
MTFTFTKPHRDVDKVFIHCSASDSPEHDNLQTLREWHVKKNGWRDIGYHYFIHKDGTCSTCRDIQKTPAAQLGHNTGSIAVCLHGLKKNNFTQRQFETLIDMCRVFDNAYNNQLTFHGHCEVSTKTCPVFDYREVLGLSLSGDRVNRPNSSPQPLAQPLLQLTDTGAAVTLLQQELAKKLNISLSSDGHFGQQTKSAVLLFQKNQGLVEDGIVGKQTWQQVLA